LQLFSAVAPYFNESQAATGGFTENIEMQQRFIRVRELASTPGRPGRLPLSINSIWRLAREGKFPQPVKLSANVTAWKLEDVEAWEREREAQA